MYCRIHVRVPPRRKRRPKPAWPRASRGPRLRMTRRWIRAIILKARQLGVSTYVAARLYHRTIHSPGLRAIILGHERRASSNLFQIVKRFHDNLGDELKPSVGTSNAEELIFDRIDSGYIVAVASGEGTGRSATAQLLHASECGFWDDLPAQMTSLMQTVPDLDGTEI